MLALAACTANPSPRCATNDGCAPGAFCHAGFCVAGGASDAATTDAACTRCSGMACVALATDPRNCGSCGMRCSGGTPVCTGGECVH